MRVSGFWRYPVKSLGGEELTTAELTADGVVGTAWSTSPVPTG